jgi:hypothetical protein
MLRDRSGLQLHSEGAVEMEAFVTDLDSIRRLHGDDIDGMAVDVLGDFAVTWHCGSRQKTRLKGGRL